MSADEKTTADLVQPRRTQDVVPREHLVDLLRSSRAPVAAVSGPVGSGKSTLLAQWYAAETEGVWVALDVEHNDPVLFWQSIITGMAAKLDGFGSECLDRLAGLGEAAVDDMPTMVVEELGHREPPVVLFLDDVDSLDDERVLASLHRLARILPPGCRLALASRSQRPIPLARLRLEGELIEIGAGDLALSLAEADQLFRSLEVTLSAETLERVVARMEGWAEGLLLVASGGPKALAALESVPGDEPDLDALAAHMTKRLLADLAHDDQDFLLKTSILRRLSAESCEAVSGSPAAGRRLARLEADSVFIVAVENAEPGWYRYHHFFRQVLRTELAERWPDDLESLHQAAFEWYRENGHLEEAIQHALAAGLRHDAAEELCRQWYADFGAARSEALRRLFDHFELDDFAGSPQLAVAAAMAFTVFDGDGDVVRTKQLLDSIDIETSDDETDQAYDGASSLRTLLLFTRSNATLHGVEASLADAEAAYALEPVGSRWRAMSALMAGSRSRLLGDAVRAEHYLTETITSLPATMFGIQALAHLASIRLDQGMIDEAVDIAGRSARMIEGQLPSIRHAGLSLIPAVHAQALATAGRWDEAEIALTTATDLATGRWGRLGPDFVAAVVTIAETALALGAIDIARAHANVADEALQLRPNMGTLTSRVEQLRAPLEMASGWSDPSSPHAISKREREVLDHLATPLSLREIADELFVSHNTVRSHVRSIYRRLDVNSRPEAVAKARTAGLLS